uniref:Uncharacterized protein n=1 Tax=Glossina pallidipes TaxID=7398 RepID=A0A1B0A8D1_GLOPL
MSGNASIFSAITILYGKDAPGQRAADTTRAWGVFKTSVEENFVSAKISVENDHLKKKKRHGECVEHDNDECSGSEMMTGTETLVRDYLEFKAARSIQRFVRGWLLRNRLAKRICAAIVIQAEWRRFYCQRLYFRKLEDLLQQRIEEYYFRAAQKIQALFRGWWSREHIHDHVRLKRLEYSAGEDLLHCVAFKLHHLIRTKVIPGVYSLKNTRQAKHDCLKREKKLTLSKVEQLLASMAFKQCNDRARQVNRGRSIRAQYDKVLFADSFRATQIPFAGPNVCTFCESKCVALYSERDADRKMAKILNMYEEACRRESKTLKLRIKKSKATISRHICLPPPTTFCGDLVRSMKKWKIIKEEHLTVDRSIFETPHNVENFLKEVQSEWNNLHGTCYCGDVFVEELEKRKKLPGSSFSQF